MGNLGWRAKGGVFGCRRGWLGIAGLAAFAFVGYFTLYGGLRATGKIRIDKVEFTSGAPSAYVAALWDRDPLWRYRLNIPHREPSFTVHKSINTPEDGKRPWSTRVILLTVKLEVALDRRGWLPWNGVRKIMFNDGGMTFGP